MKSKYRYLAPNSVTFTSLICGAIAIFSAATGELWRAGILILASYVLDLFDGILARRLNARSEFGLQLDSLVDMVSLGMAPATLYFMHMREKLMPASLIWALLIAVPVAGAFRLARFNLLPPKTSGSNDSIGLTISTGGATLALAVLTDLATTDDFMPRSWYLFLPLMLSFLMVSTIKFPSLSGVFDGWRRSVVLLTLIGGMLVFIPFIQTWFIFTGGYLGASVARAGLTWRGSDG